MRLDPIISINANKQQTQHSNQNVGALAGSASNVIFADYLNALLQQTSKPVISRHAENHAAGLLMGYITPLKITHRLEPESEISAS